MKSTINKQTKTWLMIYIFIGFLFCSCGNRKLGMMQTELEPESETVDSYMDPNTIDAYYINYGDTGRWNTPPMDGALWMRNPIIKIQMNKPNDMDLIYRQLDSAIAFAKMIGEGPEFSADITSFYLRPHSEYFELVDGYLDTVRWIPEADAYLRENRGFTGIGWGVPGSPHFVYLKTEADHNLFIENLIKDSVAYLVFYIIRYPNRASPVYGGKKMEDGHWKERQTKPYPRWQRY